MRKKQLFLVMDTETVGSIPRQIVYDVGGIVCDRNGEIYHEFSFLVDEIFTNPVLMGTAHYAVKYPEYLYRLQKNEVEIKSFRYILRYLDNLIEEYNIKTVAAYNLQFDERAMANTCELFFDNRNWLRNPVEKMCLWCASCDCLLKKKFIKMAKENGWFTEKGNIKTSAEVTYRYITGNADFEEEHRGLDDCRIEVKILTAVYKQHQKFDGRPRAFPMRIVWARDN